MATDIRLKESLPVLTDRLVDLHKQWITHVSASALAASAALSRRTPAR